MKEFRSTNLFGILRVRLDNAEWIACSGWWLLAAVSLVSAQEASILVGHVNDMRPKNPSEVLRCPVCGTSSAEASDESAYVRKRRGILVAMSTDFAIDLVSKPQVLPRLWYSHEVSPTLGLRGSWYHSSDHPSLLSSKDLCRRLESSIWTWDRSSTHSIHLPYSHGQLNAVPKACDWAQHPIHACFEKILETNAGDLSVIISFLLLNIRLRILYTDSHCLASSRLVLLRLRNIPFRYLLLNHHRSIQSQ